MNVVIYDSVTNQSVGQYTVYAQGINYQATEEECFRLAFKCLQDDGDATGKQFTDFRYVATN
jgi:hypothetical protein